jgi:NADH:ubiquinone oxidoreductase subunit 6 (subunit J)
MLMEVGSQLEAIALTAVGIILGSIAGLFSGLVLDIAFHAISDALKQPLAPSQVSETLLFAANTIFAIVEAFTDTEKLVVGLSSATSLLSIIAARLFQNPLHAFPLLFMLLLRLARAFYG